MTVGKIKTCWVVVFVVALSVVCAVGQCVEQVGSDGYSAEQPSGNGHSADGSADDSADDGKLDRLFKDNGPSTPKNELFKQFAIAISLVLVLSGCAYWLSKRVMPKLTVTRGKNIRVVETIHLGTNRRIHLLEIDGDRRILVGSTAQNVNFLADMGRGETSEDMAGGKT